MRYQQRFIQLSRSKLCESEEPLFHFQVKCHRRLSPSLISSNLLIHLFSFLLYSFPCSYYAIVRPLEYPLYMTNRTVFFMLTNVWLLPALISFTPILLGWYTTEDALKAQRANPNVCEFVANKTYAIISSLVSFWIPGLVMMYEF